MDHADGRVDQFIQVFGLEDIHQGIAELFTVLVDQNRPGYG